MSYLCECKILFQTFDYAIGLYCIIQHGALFEDSTRGEIGLSYYIGQGESRLPMISHLAYLPDIHSYPCN